MIGLIRFFLIFLLAFAQFSCAKDISKIAVLGKSKHNVLEKTGFCQKYQCKLISKQQQKGIVKYLITIPGYKDDWGDYVEPEEYTLKMFYQGNNIKSVQLSLGLFFPKNAVSGYLSHFINEMAVVVTGKRVMAPFEEFSGGPLSNCFDALASAQQKGNSKKLLEVARMTRIKPESVLKDKTITGVLYQVECLQKYTVKGQTPRYIRISAISE